MPRFAALAVILTAAVVLAACDQGLSIPSDRLLSLGTWGGDDAGVQAPRLYQDLCHGGREPPLGHPGLGRHGSFRARAVL